MRSFLIEDETEEALGALCGQDQDKQFAPAADQPEPVLPRQFPNIQYNLQTSLSSSYIQQCP